MVLPRIVLIAAVCCQIMAQSRAEAVPDLRAEVTVQREDNGTLLQGYHIASLWCYGGECGFDWLTINACGGGGAFYPKVERFRPQDGNLLVHVVDDIVHVKLEGGTYTTKLRMQLHDNAVLRGSGVLKSFSGAIVKDSPITGEVSNTRYVPLVNTNPSSVFREMDCPAMLIGITPKSPF